MLFINKKYIYFILYLSCSTIFIFLCLEFFSRKIYPVFPGARKLNNNKELINISFNKPMSQYTQSSSEYNSYTSINKYGNRNVPQTNKNSKHKLIFLGDSFTFGQGLSDKETIANLVCKNISNYDCINLGVPGSGAIAQYKKLKSYISLNKTNKKGHVIHLILASTNSNFAGNDLSDTYDELNNPKILETKARKDIIFPLLVEISKKSNLVRILRLKLGKSIRIIAYSLPQEEVTDEQLILFGHTIKKTKELSIKNNLKYNILLISPQNEHGRSLANKTLNDLRKYIDIKINKPGITNKKIFYSLDGHYNLHGSKYISKYIIESIIN